MYIKYYYYDIILQHTLFPRIINGTSFTLSSDSIEYISSLASSNRSGSAASTKKTMPFTEAKYSFQRRRAALWPPRSAAKKHASKHSHTNINKHVKYNIDCARKSPTEN